MGKKGRPLDWSLKVKDFCSLQVDIGKATDVPPHDDLCDLYEIKESINTFSKEPNAEMNQPKINK